MIAMRTTTRWTALWMILTSSRCAKAPGRINKTSTIMQQEGSTLTLIFKALTKWDITHKVWVDKATFTWLTWSLLDFLQTAEAWKVTASRRTVRCLTWLPILEAFIICISQECPWTLTIQVRQCGASKVTCMMKIWAVLTIIKIVEASTKRESEATSKVWQTWTNWSWRKESWWRRVLLKEVSSGR